MLSGCVAQQRLRRAVDADNADHRRVVGTGDGNGNWLRDDAAAVVVDRGRVGQRQRLALSQEIQRTVGNVVGPARRAVVGVAGSRDNNERRLHRALLGRGQRQRGDMVGGKITIRGKRRRHRRPVTQVNVSEADRATNRICRRIASTRTHCSSPP